MIVVSRESKTADGGVKGCSKCAKPRDRENQRYCKACHAGYMRERRAGKVQPLLTPEEWERIKAARALAS
jgi:hypothetical protein